jgi:hypothetical protein
VTIFWGNIQAGKEGNFSKHVDDADDIGGYGFGSMMHYGRFAFGLNGLQTIETIPAGIAIGQRRTLSAGDIAGIRRVQCTYTVDPLVMHVPFEGGGYRVNVTAPAYCSWTARDSAFWVEITRGAEGAGNGSVSLTVARNRAFRQREATLTVGGRTVTILQGAALR